MNERLRSFGSDYKLALDVLEFDENISPAIEYACNNAVIATTLAAARQLTFVDKQKVKVGDLPSPLVPSPLSYPCILLSPLLPSHTLPSISS